MIAFRKNKKKGNRPQKRAWTPEKNIFSILFDSGVAGTETQVHGV